jgi:thioredoxin reductase (NADPH)
MVSPYLTASLAMNETPSADDPYTRTAQIFPKLPAELIARVAAYGVEEPIRPGQTLFHRGERRADFFLVVEGEVAITRTGQMTVRKP